MGKFTSLFLNEIENQFQLVQTGQQASNEYVSMLMREHINIGGAIVNVYKLLGLKERGQLIDLTGAGAAISSGDVDGFEDRNAFNEYAGDYHSKELGQAVLQTSYIGYDFGPILTKNDRNRYSDNAPIRKHITCIKIQQPSTTNRSLKMRLERSDDGVVWTGAGIIQIEDNDSIQTAYVKESTAARFWRLRPLQFNGGINDYWAVSHLELIYHIPTATSNVNYANGFLENRNRSYSTEPIIMKGVYEPFSTDTQFNGFGMYNIKKTQILMHFESAVERLNRPIVIGDVIELPSEVQYTPDMTPIKHFVEVTDVAWSSEGYTPGYKPVLVTVTVEPMLSSEETKDIVKKAMQEQIVDTSGLFDMGIAGSTDLPIMQRVKLINDEIISKSKQNVPMNGFDTQDIDSDFIKSRDLYVEDALPPEGIPYTTGTTLPDASKSKEGEYFRLEYAPELNMAARLYKFSCAKNRWIFMEEDRRGFYNVRKPETQNYITDKSGGPAHEGKVTK